jgi:GTP-binding protein HflX
MLFERPEAGRRAVLLQVDLRRQANPDQEEFLELARSAEIDVIQVENAKRDVPHPRWFIGSGKVDELKALLAWADASLLLINHDLSPGQQRNLEQALDCRMITRTELILTIFAERARSHEGQLQVELAQLKHAQTRGKTN